MPNRREARDEPRKHNRDSPEENRTFGDVGAVSITVTGTDSVIATSGIGCCHDRAHPGARGDLPPGTGWRLRAVGQGYDDGLAELAVRNGVEVDD